MRNLATFPVMVWKKMV